MSICVKDENNGRSTPLIVYNGMSYTITQKGNLPKGWQRYVSLSAICNNELYTADLTLRSTDPGNGKLYKYDSTNNAFIELCELPIVSYSNYSQRCLASLNDKLLYIVNGDQTAYETYKKVYEYDSARNSWISFNVTTFPQSISLNTTVTLDNKIHTFGAVHCVIYWDDNTHHYVCESYSDLEDAGIVDVDHATVYDGEIHIFTYEAQSKHYKFSNGTWVFIDDVPSNISTNLSKVIVTSTHNGIHIIFERNHYRWFNGEWTLITGSLPYRVDSGLAYSLLDSNFNKYGSISILGGNALNTLGSMYEIYHYLIGSPEFTEIPIYIMNNSWTEVGNLPSDFGNSGVSVVYNNELHILGLNNGTGHYKLTSNGWVSVSTLPMSIGAYEYFPPEWDEDPGYYVYTSGFAVVLNNKIHLVYHHKHYTWDPSNGWVLLHSNADVPFYSNGCVIVFNNEIHILGYWYDTGSMLGPDPEGEHYVYSNGQWSEINPGNYQDDRYRLNDLYLIKGGIEANAFVYNNELYLLSNENASWDSVTRKSYKNLFKWNGNSSNSIWTEVTTARNVIPWIIDNDAKQRKSSIIFTNEYGIDYLYENYQYRFNGTTWELINDNNPFSIKYGGSANFLNDLGYVMVGSKYYTSGKILDPLYGHLFNKIKGIWTKVNVPTYDEYGNCHIEERAKKVKAVWVGDANNKARKIYF